MCIVPCILFCKERLCDVSGTCRWRWVCRPGIRSKKNCQSPAFIVELKWNQSAETAIDQIKKKKYAECLQDYAGEILLVGINYDRDSKEDNKKHFCKIENIKK